MRARGWPITTAGLVLAAVVSAGVASLAEDRVSGLITRTYVIVEDTELSGDVTCDVTGAACFSFGAPGVELRLNGYSITGKADPVTGCAGALTAGRVRHHHGRTGQRLDPGPRARPAVPQLTGSTSRPRPTPVSRASRPPPTAPSGIFVAGHLVRHDRRGQRGGPQRLDGAAVRLRRHMNRRPQQPGPAEQDEREWLRGTCRRLRHRRRRGRPRVTPSTRTLSPATPTAFFWRPGHARRRSGGTSWSATRRSKWATRARTRSPSTSSTCRHAGQTTFENNVCVTSVGAPCPVTWTPPPNQ